MSLKKKAAQVRAKGSKNVGEDSVLAHISPKEAALLKARGGSGQRDPDTGVLHFAEGGGGYGDGPADSGDSGGWGGGLDGAPDVGTIGGGLNADDSAPGGWGGVEGDAGLGGGGLDNMWSWNAAMDSQGANESLGLGVNSDFTGGVDYGTVDTDTALDQFGRKAKGMLIGQAASRLGIPGIAMGLGQVGAAKTPGGQANAFGTTAANIGLSALGPVGMAAQALGLGGMAGRALAAFEGTRSDAARAEAGKAGATSGGRGGGADFDLGGVLTGLAGLYQGGKASDNASQSAQMAQGQAQSLADMYGPNSPYAQQLRQQLERKDAAGGRRSQYGPREVELQARLADIASRNAPNVLNANKQAYDMRGAGNKVGGQQLAGVLDLANKTGLTGYAQKGLGSLWDSVGSGSGGPAINNPSAYTAPSGGNFWDGWFD